jgi:hypothetical protein
MRQEKILVPLSFENRKAGFYSLKIIWGNPIRQVFAASQLD